MTGIKAIANRRSIVFKIDTTPFFSKRILRDSYPYDARYYVNESGGYSDIINMGVCYYTNDSNNVTYIPFDSTQFIPHTSGGKIEFFECGNESVTVNNLTVKTRAVSSMPIMCLIEGLTPNTTYHVSGFYETSDNERHVISYSVVTTKPEAAEGYTGITFNPVTISYSASNYNPTYAENSRAALEENLIVVKRMYDDATNVENRTYSPTIMYTTNNVAANSNMEFNCKFGELSNVSRTVIVHELQHNHFNPKGILSGEHSTDSNVIKFMEFATDCEGATWGRLSSHYYPIISSESYDYIDDYLVCMATDVDYLFGTNS